MKSNTLGRLLLVGILAAPSAVVLAAGALGVGVGTDVNVGVGAGAQAGGSNAGVGISSGAQAGGGVDANTQGFTGSGAAGVDTRASEKSKLSKPRRSGSSFNGNLNGGASGNISGNAQGGN